MDSIVVLRLAAERAYDDLLDSIKDLDRSQAWATVSVLEGEYLNTTGNIVAIIQHVASSKYANGSAFSKTPVRGRDVFARTKEIGADWEKTKQFLMDSQEYWMESWSAMQAQQLENEVDNIRGKKTPSWKIINMMIGHDHYHAGQITLIRNTTPGVSAEPDMNFDEEEKYAKEAAWW